VPALDDAAALIEEARSRTRRRRRRGAAFALLALAAALASYLADSGGGSVTVAETASRPFVNVRAFEHAGELAFISRGALWVLDGSAHSLRRLRAPRGYAVASPTFSHDGRWLAYLATRSSDSATVSQLWVARADGSGAREIGGLAVNQLVGWSPTADVLAAVTDTDLSISRYYFGPQPTTLSLITPAGRTRRLFSIPAAAARVGRVWDAVWSPHGNAVAVSTNDFRRNGGTTVRAFPIDGARPTQWFSIPTRQGLAGICTECGGANAVIADLAGWYPHWGIAFWAICCGADHISDDTPLELLTAPGATPHLIARTLSDGTTDAIASSPTGGLALVASTGGREIGIGKQVSLCDRSTLTCEPVPGASLWQGRNPQTCVIPCGRWPHAATGKPGSGVTLDPSFSPSGRLLAYVKAPEALTSGWPELAWYDAHELYVFDPATGATRRMGKIGGADVPAWSSDGRELLYVGNDGLWMTSLASGKSVEIEYPLFHAGYWRGLQVDYYGQLPWSAQFSWWSP
jgi:WD40-like Beta Propeller Repeat